MRAKFPYFFNIGPTLSCLIVSERKMVGCDLILDFGKICHGVFSIRFVFYKGLDKKSLLEKF